MEIKEEDLWFRFDNMDKLVHIGVFVVLGFCYRVAFMRQRFLLFVVVMAVYALLTEILQEIMSLGRSMEFADFVADILGVVLGCFLWERGRKVFEKIIYRGN